VTSRTRLPKPAAIAGSSRTRPAPKTIRGSRATPNAASGPGSAHGRTGRRPVNGSPRRGSAIQPATAAFHAR